MDSLIERRSCLRRSGHYISRSRPHSGRGLLNLPIFTSKFRRTCSPAKNVREPQVRITKEKHQGRTGWPHDRRRINKTQDGEKENTHRKRRTKMQQVVASTSTRMRQYGTTHNSSSKTTCRNLSSFSSLLYLHRPL